MEALFGGPRTPLTDAIDRAVSDQATSEDIALHIEICDLVNDSPDNARVARRQLQRKLQPKAKPADLLKALVVIETLVKNCGEPFHLQVADREFMDAYVKLLLYKPPVTGVVRDKALDLLQTWAEVFAPSPQMAAVRQAYDHLRAQGVEFPARNLDAMAPIYTPAATVAAPPAAATPAATNGSATGTQQSDEELARELDRQMRLEDERERQARAQSQPPVAITQRPPPSGHHQRYRMQVQRLAAGQRVEASEQQVTKLRGDLDVVRDNVRLFSNLLEHVDPSERVQDNELLPDLYATCNAMQQRISELLMHLLNERLVTELLEVNDQLNTSLTRYRDRAARDPPAPQTQPVPTEPVERVPTAQRVPAASNGDLLINMDNDPTPTMTSRPPAAAAATATLAHESTTDEPDDFDMFSQHRGVTYTGQRTAGYQTEEPTETFRTAAQHRMNIANSTMFEPDEMFSSSLSALPKRSQTPEANSDLLIDFSDSPANTSAPVNEPPLPGHMFDELSPSRPSGHTQLKTLDDARRKQLENANDDLFGL